MRDTPELLAVHIPEGSRFESPPGSWPWDGGHPWPLDRGERWWDEAWADWEPDPTWRVP